MKQIDIIVKKLLKNKGKIISIEKLRKIFQDLEVEKTFYKKIFYLKNRGYLVSVKKDLFYIKEPHIDIDEEEIIEQFYRKILHKYIKENFLSKYFIGGIKALEIWNNNFSIPDKITIVNTYKRATETLLKGKKIFNTIYKVKGFNLDKSFRYFKKQTEKIDINGKKFIIANYELALLESFYSPNFLEQKYIEEIIKKNIRKNYRKINIENFEYFLKIGKYGLSCKRIYEISLRIRPDFAKNLKKILLKRYWL